MKSEEAERAIRIPAMSLEDRTQKVSTTTITASSGNQALTAQDALAYLKDVKDLFHDKKEIFLDFLDIMKDFKAKRINTEGIILRVKELFRGYPSLILGFGAFLPKGYEITLSPQEEKKHAGFDEAITLPPQEKREKKPAEFEEAINFVNKIKARFEDDVHIYKSFLDILYKYREEKKSIKQVYNEISSLFKNHRDLQNEFTHFLPEISTISHTSPHGHDMLQDDKSFTPIRTPGFIDKFGEGAYGSNLDHGINVHHRDLDHDKLRIRAGKEKYRKGEEDKRESGKNRKDIEQHNRESCMHRISQRVEDLDAELMLQGDHILHPIRLKIRDKQTLQQMNEDNKGTNCDRGRDDKLDVVAKDLSLPRKDLPSNNISSLSKEDVNIFKPISERDLSNCLQCTPSYRLLPKHYMVPLSSHRTEADAAVLNDVWVSVTSGSEEYSFLHKNQYEEILSKCEDDRFEMDMLVESVNATTKRVEDLLEKMQDSSNKTGSPIKVENYLSALNLRCIERLYGDHGLEVTDFLQKNACVALPVILTRLKQKQEEWFKCRAEFRKVWTEVYAKNYHKSLDHCSFYFKVQDVKNLCKKALLTEIEDISRKKHDVDNVLVAITEGNQWPIVCAMAFDLNDSDIHNDLYEIIQHSCREICSSREQMEKLMSTWTEFVEPLLGIPVQPKNAEETKDAEKSKIWSSQIVQKATSMSDNGNAGNHLNEAGEEDTFVQDGINVQMAMLASNDETDTEGTLMDTDQASLQIDSIDSTSLLQKAQEESEHQAMGFSSDSRADIKYEDEESAQRFIAERKNAHKSGNDVLNCSSGKAAEHAPENSEEGAMYNDWDSHIENEGEVRDMVDALDVDGEGMYFSSKNFLHSEHVPPALHENEVKCSRFFYGNDQFYVLIRLCQILYERILLAKMNSRSDEQKRTNTNHNGLPHGYARFICALYNLLGGLIDNIMFEDECRATTGTQSYVLFTLDNLVYKVVKQLQVVASDDMCNSLLQLHAYEESRKPERFCSIVYYENARALLHDENIYRFECSSCPTYLSIQLMEYGFKNPTVTSVSIEPRFSAYLYDDLMSAVLHGKQMHTVFLKRNKRKKTNNDECPLPYKGMEDFWMINGLECRISCNSSIVSYVLDTEDVLFRKKRKTCLAGLSCRNPRNPSKTTKVQNFHQFVARCLEV